MTIGKGIEIFFAALVAAFLQSQNAIGADKFLENETAKALAAGNPVARVKALDDLVDADNVVAATELGLIYRHGKDVPRDYAKARKYLKIAATPNLVRMWHKYGFPKAQYALAVMLRDGVGGKADASAAVSWFERAAEQNYQQAQLELAQMYFNGTGIKRDPERAFIWASIAEPWASGEAQKEMDRIRDLSQKQLKPGQLAKAGALVKTWKPRSG